MAGPGGVAAHSTAPSDRPGGVRLAAVLGGVLWGALACSSEAKSGPSLRVGVLLPYTGEASAISANLERGAVMAVSDINRAGGAGDVPVEVVFGNTFSDAERSANEAHALAEQNVVVVIGPGGDEVSGAVHRALSQHGIPLISPIASTTAHHEMEVDSAWFRMSPTSQVFGQNLAKLAGDDDMHRVTAVVSNDDYHSELGQAFAQRFASYGELEQLVTLNDSDQNLVPLAEDIDARMDAGLEGVMLAVHPRVAARLATEVAVLRAGKPLPRWYLTPRLKTDLLLQNASPGSLEGAIGIGAEVFSTTRGEFEARFARGAGDVPFDATFFMYDATAVALLAMDRALSSGGTLPEGLPDAIEEVASFGGVLVHWNEFEEARQINRDQRALQYTGLTGPVILADDGSRIIGTSSVWGVQGGQIVEY